MMLSGTTRYVRDRSYIWLQWGVSKTETVNLSAAREFGCSHDEFFLLCCSFFQKNRLNGFWLVVAESGKQLNVF